MANSLGIYNPIFYAQEALIHLEAALGLANRVHRGYENERDTKNVGETISIRRPSTFTAQDAPSSAQDLNTESVDITLSNWKEVKFGLTDKEQAFSEDRIIADHIRPAAYALAADLDERGALQYRNCPWYHDQAGGTAAISDLTTTRKIAFNNKVPLKDPNMVHFMMSGDLEADLLANSVFHQANTDATGGATQLRGNVGTRFGMNFFANQNTQDHTSGGMTDKAGAAVGIQAAGATSISIDGIDASGVIKAGDILVVTGMTQQFACTADVTASTGAATVAITPKLPSAIADNTVITVIQSDKKENLLFHRNAMALAMARLPDAANRLPGVIVQSVQDPITGLAIRARLFYEGQNSKLFVALDILYGWKTLDPNLMVRMRA